MKKSFTTYEEMENLRTRSTKWMSAYYVALACAILLFVFAQVYDIYSFIFYICIGLCILSTIFLGRASFLLHKYEKTAQAKLMEIHRLHFGTEKEQND